MSWLYKIWTIITRRHVITPDGFWLRGKFHAVFSGGSDAVSGFGTLLKKGDGAAPEVFATVAEVTNIGGPSLSTDVIEVTNHSSPGARKEFIAGLLDDGEVTFDLNFLPTDGTHDASTGILADRASRTKRNWKLVFPQFTPAEAAGFQAIVTGFEASAPTDDKLGASVTLKVTGAVDWAATP